MLIQYGILRGFTAFIIMSLNESSDMAKQRQVETELAAPSFPSFTDELSLRSGRSHKKYGNMLVLLETDRILITLGADYICFIFSFLAFLAAGVYLIVEVNSAFDSTTFKVINGLLVIVQLFSYLNIAVSNPGIVLQETLNSEEKQEVERFCKICCLRMAKGTFHCKQCDVCIRNYDHHCPWTSKCIGGSNLRRFYVFQLRQYTSSTTWWSSWSPLPLLLDNRDRCFQIIPNPTNAVHSKLVISGRYDHSYLFVWVVPLNYTCLFHMWRLNMVFAKFTSKETEFQLMELRISVMVMILRLLDCWIDNQIDFLHFCVRCV